VPGGPANTRHIEHRICGADANPYLAAAAILAGIHRGIREQLDPGAGRRQRLCPGQGTAAHRLADHPAALENSAWARDALGQEFLGVYLAVKRAEYRQFMAEVGEQDWRWYLHQA
jgi:glutamine synthetase